jgi:hypothetical protein
MPSGQPEEAHLQIFQSLCAAIAEGLKVENAILDGEIVCIRPVFTGETHGRCPCRVDASRRSGSAIGGLV